MQVDKHISQAKQLFDLLLQHSSSLDDQDLVSEIEKQRDELMRQLDRASAFKLSLSLSARPRQPQPAPRIDTAPVQPPPEESLGRQRKILIAAPERASRQSQKDDSRFVPSEQPAAIDSHSLVETVPLKDNAELNNDLFSIISQLSKHQTDEVARDTQQRPEHPTNLLASLSECILLESDALGERRGRGQYGKDPSAAKREEERKQQVAAAQLEESRKRGETGMRLERLLEPLLKVTKTLQLKNPDMSKSGLDKGAWKAIEETMDWFLEKFPSLKDQFNLPILRDVMGAPERRVHPVLTCLFMQMILGAKKGKKEGACCRVRCMQFRALQTRSSVIHFNLKELPFFEHLIKAFIAWIDEAWLDGQMLVLELMLASLSKWLPKALSSYPQHQKCLSDLLDLIAMGERKRRTSKHHEVEEAADCQEIEDPGEGGKVPRKRKGGRSAQDIKQDVAKLAREFLTSISKEAQAEFLETVSTVQFSLNTPGLSLCTVIPPSSLPPPPPLPPLPPTISQAALFSNPHLPLSQSLTLAGWDQDTSSRGEKSIGIHTSQPPHPAPTHPNLNKVPLPKAPSSEKARVKVAVTGAAPLGPHPTLSTPKEVAPILKSIDVEMKAKEPLTEIELQKMERKEREKALMLASVAPGPSLPKVVPVKAQPFVQVTILPVKRSLESAGPSSLPLKRARVEETGQSSSLAPPPSSIPPPKQDPSNDPKWQKVRSIMSVAVSNIAQQSEADVLELEATLYLRYQREKRLTVLKKDAEYAEEQAHTEYRNRLKKEKREGTNEIMKINVEGKHWSLRPLWSSTHPPSRPPVEQKDRKYSDEDELRQMESKVRRDNEVDIEASLLRAGEKLARKPKHYERRIHFDSSLGHEAMPCGRMATSGDKQMQAMWDKGVRVCGFCDLVGKEDEINEDNELPAQLPSKNYFKVASWWLLKNPSLLPPPPSPSQLPHP